MMKMNRIIGSLAMGAMFWGCSDTGSDDNGVAGGASGDAGIVAVTDWEVAGVSQKGPFVTGSAVTVQELDGITLKQTGKSFKGTIKSDKPPQKPEDPLDLLALWYQEGSCDE